MMSRSNIQDHALVAGSRSAFFKQFEVHTVSLILSAPDEPAFLAGYRMTGLTTNRLTY